MGKGRCVALSVLIVYLAALCCAEQASDNYKSAVTQTWAEKLKKDLMANYDRSLRPTQHYNVTHVEIKLTITHVDIDEESSKFSVHGWLKMDWNDDKLKWNPAEYSNLNVIRTDPDSVWKPDIVLYNNAKGSDQQHYGSTNILLYNTGKVLWVPPTDYHSFCELNLRFWPFDYQTCFLKIGSWTYDAYKLNLTGEEIPEKLIMVPNNQWSIRKMTVDRHVTYYPCCVEPYVDLQYNITLQRHSSTYKAVVISPAFVIILLALSVFWLPPHCGEKIILNGIIGMIVTVFLIYFAQQLPAMSGNTPLIVSFFSTTLYMIAISTIISIMVIRLTRTKQQHQVPRMFKNQLDGCLGSVLCLSIDGSLPSEEDKEVAGAESGCDPKQRDWCRLASLIDRLAFVVYLIIFIIFIVYYSL